MPDDRDTPGPAQEFLSGTATHVGHICVVDREAEDPAGGKKDNKCVWTLKQSVTVMLQQYDTEEFNVNHTENKASIQLNES